MVKQRAIVVRVQRDDLLITAHEAAAALRCHPRQLCIALLMKTFEGNLVDAVLDGDDPNAIAPRAGAKAPRDERGPRQKHFLNWVIRRAGPSGTFACSFKEASHETGLHQGQVSGMVRSLIRRGDVSVARAGHKSPSVWTLPPHLIGADLP